MKTILWWGRFDPNYSRNRIMRTLQQELGYNIIDFIPLFSKTACLEILLKRLPLPDVVWVPCFRQRDIKTASRWANSRHIPLIFDPLISAWDKQVFERKKFPPDSRQAQNLLKQETIQFQSADKIIADSAEHARFFSETFAITADKIAVIPVGADDKLFKPDTLIHEKKESTEVLFYGSFIHLQAPQVIINAARQCQNHQDIQWYLLGSGPLLDECRQLAEGLKNVMFEDWIQYEKLPARIHKADILLGIFGSSHKAERVIPNKVYQAIACGRPVVTRNSPAYPQDFLQGEESGVYQIPANDPQALCEMVTKLSRDTKQITTSAIHARNSYEKYFSNEQLRQALEDVFASLDT